MPSYWEATRREPLVSVRPEPLPAHAGAVVVGGGFTGLTCAYYLARQGVDVVVCEKARVGSGASGRNGGQVLPGWSLDMFQVVQRFSHETAVMMWSVSEEAVQRVRNLVAEERIDCGLTTVGHIEGAADAQGVAQLEHERRVLSSLCGRDLELWEGRQIAERTGALGYQAGLFEPDAMALHPLDYVLGLVRAAQRHGAHIHQSTEVLGVEREPGRVFQVSTSRGPVSADHVIFAVNGFSPRFLHWLRARILPVYSAQIAVEIPADAELPDFMPTVSVSAPSFHYFRRAGQRDFIFGGRTEEGKFGTLHRSLREVIPALAGAKMTCGWTGRLGISSDGMPHLVRLRSGAWGAAGFSGHGVALSTQMGWFLAQALLQSTPDDRIQALSALSWSRWPLRPYAAWRSLGPLKLSNPRQRRRLVSH